MLNSRLLRLEKLMAAAQVDAVVLNPGPTLIYLTSLHFHLMERPTLFLFRRGERPAIILPDLETAKLNDLQFPLTVHTYGDDPSTWQELINQALRPWRKGSLVVGLEAQRMRFLEMDFLQKAIPEARFSAAESVLGSLRAQKDRQEVSLMRKAAEIAQSALTSLLPHIKPGVTEQELESELTIHLLRTGSSLNFLFLPSSPVDPIRQSHAVPSSRPLGSGELLVIDWGASFDGYFSDLTRTFAVGEVDSELREIYEVVKAANAAEGQPESLVSLPAAWMLPPRKVIEDAVTKSILPTAPVTAWAWRPTNLPISMPGIRLSWKKG
jgi:Xaa-Pro dipeptidase